MSQYKTGDLPVNTSFTNDTASYVTSGTNTFTEGCAFLLPVLFLLVSYIYLLYGLIKKKIWKQRPFYLSYIGLGISDCILLSYRAIVCVQKISQTDISSDSPTVYKALTFTNYVLYNAGYMCSSQLLGVISLMRALAVFFPFFFNHTVHEYSGGLVVFVGLVTALVPWTVAHCTVVSFWHVNVITGEFILLIQSPLPESIATMMSLYIIYPAVMTVVLPICIYVAIAVKLRLLSTNDAKGEMPFLWIGSLLATVSLLVLVPYMRTIVTGDLSDWTQSPILLMMAHFCEVILFGMNPYIYWMFDPFIRQMVIPPWRLHKKTQVHPLTTSAHTMGNDVPLVQLNPQ